MWGEAPSGGASFLLLAAQTRGAGSRAEQVAAESIGRICRNRAPHMKFKKLFGPEVVGKNRTLGYFRVAAQETGNVLVRPLADELACVCGAVRTLFTASAADVKGSAPPVALPVGLRVLRSMLPSWVVD